MAYAFRIQFRIADATPLGSAESSLELKAGHHVFTLASADGSAIDNSTWFVFIGRPYEGEHAAYQAGNRAKDALRWSSLRWGIGLDVGQGTRLGVFIDHHRQGVRTRPLDELPPQILSNTHGLEVYEEGKMPPFDASRASVVVVLPADSFAKTVVETADTTILLVPPADVALDLYASAKFLEAPEAGHSATMGRARFLTLWTALECLTQLLDAGRGPEATLIINGLIHTTKAASLPEGEIASIIGGLKNLKTRSIRSLCRALVEQYAPGREYIGRPARTLVDECYEIRCGLAHREASVENLSSHLPPLEELLRDVLQAAVRERSEPYASPPQG